MDAYKNFAVSLVAIAPNPPASGTALTVAPGHGVRFPAPPFNLTIWPSGLLPEPPNAEIARVTAVMGDVLSLARAQEGSAARVIQVGDRVAEAITEKTIADLAALGGVPGGPHHATHEPGGADALANVMWTDRPNALAAPLAITSQFVGAGRKPSLKLTSDIPMVEFVENTAPPDRKNWQIFATGEHLYFQATDDADTIVLNYPFIINRRGDVKVSSRLQVVALESDTGLGWGAYIPVASAFENLSEVQTFRSIWSRVGNMVTVGGILYVAPIAIGLITFQVSIPVPSIFSGSSNGMGTFCANTVQTLGAVFSNGYGMMTFQGYGATIGIHAVAFQFIYEVPTPEPTPLDADSPKPRPLDLR